MARIIVFLAALIGRFFAFSYLYDRVLRRIWAKTTYKRILRNFFSLRSTVLFKITEKEEQARS